MERSQSCTNFGTTMASSGSGIHETPLSSGEKLTLDIREAVELHQVQLAKLKISGSNDQIQTVLPSLQPPLACRKRTLRRQLYTETSPDDNDYSADLDEKGDDSDDQDGCISIDEESIGTSDILHRTTYISRHATDTTNSSSSPILLQHQHSQQSLQSLQMRRPRRQHQSSLNLDNTSPLSANSTFSSSLCSSSSSSSCQRTRHLKHEDSFDSNTTPDMSPMSRRHNFAMIKRDSSIYSDSSHYSSVDSLLEARKPNPETILNNLGFGSVDETDDVLSRIPKRFLKPSQVRGIDTDAFVKRLQVASNLADHSVLGYRGLTGNPDMPPSKIVAKIMERFEVNQMKKSMGSMEHSIQ